MNSETGSYKLHSSKKLKTLFKSQDLPHQGQHPEQAKVLIMGLDANYDSNISTNKDFFRSLLEYHQDGVGFWESNGIHHPFLLPSYPYPKNTGGVPHYRKFSWLGLTSDYAKHISFLELLPYPTTGRRKADTFLALFSIEHAQRIDEIILSGKPKLVLISNTLFEYMLEAKQRYGVFTWLPPKFKLGALKKVKQSIIFGDPDFSSTTCRKSTCEELGLIIRNYCALGILTRKQSATTERSETTRKVKRIAGDISPDETIPDPGDATLTEPRTWGVWKIPQATTEKCYRIGNYPIRGKELVSIFGSAKLVALYMDKDKAKSMSINLNRSK